MTKDASFDLWRASAINPCNSLMFLFWRNLTLHLHCPNAKHQISPPCPPACLSGLRLQSFAS